MKRRFVTFVLTIFLLAALIFSMFVSAFASSEAADSPIEISVLILPKFENGELSGDFPGEAQYYYEAYCQNADIYEIAGGTEGSVLHVKDGIALYVTGMGKVAAALAVTAVLSDSRFDFSHALILSTGCAGSAIEYGTMGDVYVISAAADGNLGHNADSRDLSDPTQVTTWYHDESYDSTAYRYMDPELTAQVYDLVKDIKLETTDKTRAYMSEAFDGADWAVRDPQVLLGTSVSSDDYWKGEAGHANSVLIAQTYNCPDPYAATEMEDVAVAIAVDRLGLLDHLVILRDSVNTDVFMNGATPESLWDSDYVRAQTEEESEEGADIFATAMENNFKVGSVIIQAFLDGTISFD